MLAGAHPLDTTILRRDTLKPDSIVKTIHYCGDTYFVTTEDGKTEKVWEFNLRFNSDTSDSGPNPVNPCCSASACAATARRSCFRPPRNSAILLRGNVINRPPFSA